MKTIQRLRLLLLGATLCTLSSGSAWAASITGQWDFTSGLSATIGTALDYGDGAGGVTASGTLFGTTSAFGIPTIVPTDAAGIPTGPQVDAAVMSFPRMATSAEGYKMWSGAAANGTFSAGDVNQWSLVMDIYYPLASSSQYRALIQTGAANSNDADFFVGSGTVSPSPNGIGISGQYDGVINPDTWYRIALVVDLEAGAGNPSYFKYINGNLVGSQSLFNTRFALWSAESGNPAWILSDEDGETQAGFLNHVSVYNGALSAGEIAALGGIANGAVVPEPTPLALLLGAGGAFALIRRRRQS